MGRRSKVRNESIPQSQPGTTKKGGRHSRVSTKKPNLAPPPAPSITAIPQKKSKRNYQGFDENAIKNYQELMAALKAQKVQITLADNIIVQDNILINYDVAINLNGFSIIAEESLPGARVLDIRSGEVILTGRGKIFAMGERGVAIRVFGAISTGVPNYTTLTIDEGISLFAPDAYGILISPNLGAAYGLTVNFAGQIFARDGICVANGIRSDGKNAPRINLKSSARIIADETAGTALEAAGCGSWQISMARLRGAVGARLKSGRLEFSYAQVQASQGPAFLIEDGRARELDVIIDGGAYLSEQASAIDGSATAINDFSVKSGDFYAPNEAIAENLQTSISIWDANFRNDVAKYLAENDLQNDFTLTRAGNWSGNMPEQLPSHVDLSNQTPSAQVSTVDLSQSGLALIDAQGVQGLAAEPRIADESTSSTNAQDTPRSSDSVFPNTVFSDTSTELNYELSSAKDFPEADWFEESDDLLFPDFVSDIVEPFPERLMGVPELKDEETDEQEILRDLVAESLDMEETETPAQSKVKMTPEPQAHSEASRPVMELQEPKVIDLPAPQVAPADETAVARIALQDALQEIKKLRAEDYEAGFATLEQAINLTEQVLVNPMASLMQVQTVAGQLLEAFDGLEERNELTMSDDELDELFYHGAVLKEMANNDTPALARIVTPTPSETEIIKRVNNDTKQARSYEPEPDFTMLSEILSVISELELANYTEASQANLLSTLDRAQLVLTDLHATQSAIDEIASSLLAEMSDLELVHHVRKVVEPIKTLTPAPVVNRIIPAAMLDEMAPNLNWTIGTTMIDELTPFITDATTRQKMIRAMRPWVSGLLEITTEPFRKVCKGFAVGVKAGLSAYRDVLQSSH